MKKVNRLDPESNKMWSSSRMMLPEHIAVINEHNKRLEESDLAKGPKRPSRERHGWLTGNDSSELAA